MTRLTALIDGSYYSQSVCDHAAWIAGRTGSSVDIVHVLGRRDVSSEPADLSGSIGLGARSALLEELVELDGQKARLAQKRGRAILEDASARVRAAGVDAVTVRLRNGDLAQTVEELEGDSDLVVIGKRGEAADFATLHLGSNLERVVRSVRKPVLVASRAFKPVERFLIAFDGGPSATKAVEHVARSHVFSDLKCRLLVVGTGSDTVRRQLAAAECRLGEAGYEVESEVIAGQPEVVISSKAESGELQLLVMGAYGHSRIRSLIIGSTTTQMLRSCLIPVLLFR